MVEIGGWGKRADLRYANLEFADLRFANLRYTKSGSVCRMDFGGWSICIREDKTSISCQTKGNDFWLRAKPKDVACMDEDAKGWWEIHGPAVKSAIEVVMNKAQQGEGVQG